MHSFMLDFSKNRLVYRKLFQFCSKQIILMAVEYNIHIPNGWSFLLRIFDHFFQNLILRIKRRFQI